MKTATKSTASEVKYWLKSALSKENLQDFHVTITGSPEEGEGFIGEVIFVSVAGIDKNGLNKKYDLVVKCSKASKALMEKSPALQSSYVREIYLYEKIFPLFKQFQAERAIEEPFDSIPKFYGTFTNEDRYVIVLENLKQIGYDMWSINRPLPREHVDLVVKEYGKFHATSIAMREQEPEKFKEIADTVKDDIFQEFFKTTNFVSILENSVEEIYHLLKDHLDEEILNKWLNFKNQIRFVCLEMTPTNEDLQVIIHGDCWNNNFMYKYEDTKKSILSRVSILDWQISRLSSPVIDLSYFLFSCLSAQDVPSMDAILRNYYDSLSNHLEKLGSTYISKYTFDKFLEEWTKYSRFGIVLCQLTIKIAYIDREEKPDIAKSAENGEDISKSFEFGIKNELKMEFINRMKPVVQLAAETKLI